MLLLMFTELLPVKAKVDLQGFFLVLIKFYLASLFVYQDLQSRDLATKSEILVSLARAHQKLADV